MAVTAHRVTKEITLIPAAVNIGVTLTDPKKLLAQVRDFNREMNLAWLVSSDISTMYDAASHKKTRVKITVDRLSTATQQPLAPFYHGVCNAVAWFPPDHTAFTGHPCLSANLSATGSEAPGVPIDAMIQIHKDILVWLWVQGKDYAIEWKDTIYRDHHLLANTDDGVTWIIYFEPWYAGHAPDWPTWLLD